MKKPTHRLENKLRKSGYRLIAGVDEVGRGAWAGPLVAAAVILPANCKIKGVNDSKKLTPAHREKLYPQIIKTAVEYSFCVISQKQIDRMGISPANKMALRGAVSKLKTKPHYVLVDGFPLIFRSIESQAVIRGDSQIFSIAAASIIAKVFRDRIMRKYHIKYPGYNFDENKGYGTRQHHRQLKALGICDLHRLSFEPMKSFR
ncbi:MAG: ribonuclease HII [Patescibacteria group bacterium]|jgi:ribonuclease HII